MEKVIASTALTMSTLDVAEVTGKRHADVLRDARKMLKDIGIPERKFAFSYRGDDGKDHPVLNLPKRECIILVSGYDVVMRAKIIDRWMALEAAFTATAEAAVNAALGEVKKSIGGIVKSVVHREIGDILPGIVEDAIGADPRVAVVMYRPALQVLVDHDVPSKKRRGFSQRVSKRLIRFCSEQGVATRISRETGRFLFHVDVIEAWLKVEGTKLIRDHIDAVRGQGVFHLVQPKRS